VAEQPYEQFVRFHPDQIKRVLLGMFNDQVRREHAVRGFGMVGDCFVVHLERRPDVPTAAGETSRERP
jgi:hypothetical protein